MATTITRDEVFEVSPPLNERGRVALVSPRRGLRVLLTADENAYTPDGGRRVVERGKDIRFQNSRAEVTLEQFELLRQHPVYTGDGEPKQVFLEHERAITQSGGVQVVDGAISSGSSSMPAPLHGWDKMTDKAIRAAVKQGLVASPVDALLYERQHRDRPGVIMLLGHAIAMGVDDLPTAMTMRKVEKQAASTAPPLHDPTAPSDDDFDDDDEPVAAYAVPTDDEVRAEIAAAIADAEVSGDIDAGDDEPAPEEGVL